MMNLDRLAVKVCPVAANNSQLGIHYHVAGRSDIPLECHAVKTSGNLLEGRAAKNHIDHRLVVAYARRLVGRRTCSAVEMHREAVLGNNKTVGPPEMRRQMQLHRVSVSAPSDLHP